MNQDFQLWQGDCLEVMPRLPSKFFHAIIADLPSQRTNCTWDSIIPLAPLWAEFKRLIKSHGTIILFGQQPFTSMLLMSNLDWYKHCWVWEKNHAANFLNAKIQPLVKHEDILIFGEGAITYNPQIEKGKPKLNRSGNPIAERRKDSIYANNPTILANISSAEYYPVTILPFGSGAMWERMHPTQKPVSLLKYLIQTYTNPNEIVLDCCYGSGTCGVACMETGRKFVGIEKDSHYFNVGLKRITDASRAANGQPKQLTGQPSDYSDLALFAEVA